MEGTRFEGLRRSIMDKDALGFQAKFNKRAYQMGGLSEGKRRAC